MNLLVGILAVGAIGFLVFKGRSSGLIKSPGAARKPVKKDSLTQQVADILLEEHKLPSKEFRRYLGTLYPDLAMAFRQSLHLGLVRYTEKHWNQPLTEALIPEVVARIVNEYGQKQAPIKK